MTYPCESCSKRFERAVGEWRTERERFEERLKDGHASVCIPARTPDLSFLKDCPYQMEHCPLKGGEA
jgi:hypothetical protein